MEEYLGTLPISLSWKRKATALPTAFPPNHTPLEVHQPSGSALHSGEWSVHKDPRHEHKKSCFSSLTARASVQKHRGPDLPDKFLNSDSEEEEESASLAQDATCPEEKKSGDMTLERVADFDLVFQWICEANIFSLASLSGDLIKKSKLK